jgi:hypothetical protein
MTRASRSLAVGLLWAASAALLCACGRVGTLEQPAPLYGAKAKADYEAKKAAAAKANQDEGEPEPLAPDTPPVDAPKPHPPTLREQPAPGMHPEPNAPGPGGVFPDPYAQPQ